MPGETIPVVPQRLALSPSEAAAVLGVSRPTIYGLLSSGSLRSVRAGARRLISVAAIEDFLNGAAP